MRHTYLLAGENLELARAEVEAVLKSDGKKVETEPNGRTLLSREKIDHPKRLGLVHETGEIIKRSESLETDHRPEGSFAVHAQNLGETEKDTEKIEEELGEKLSTGENTVDLEHPDEEILVYILDNEYLIARLEERIDRGLYEERKNQERPFSSPVSLDPVLARVLVNLAEVPIGGSLLDPMCGTGGILIEAGLCGVNVFGADLQEKMVEGSRKNLEEYGIINYDIRKAEISEIQEEFDRKFDGAVTDLPYGKASKTEGSPVEEFLENAPELTDGKTVFMYNEPEINGLESEFEIYVHKNLTRYIFSV